MNYLIKAWTRRIPGTIAGLNKYYHNYSLMSDAGYNIVGTLKNEQSICRLIQKTIIPLNIVKPKPAILDLPVINYVGKLDYSLPEKIDQEPEKQIIDPIRRQEKKAHRMLIIRRKKMNRHKYKKRQRKMKFTIAKIKRERRMTKEVQFRQEIASKLKEARKFDAESYVADKLEMYRKKILPSRLHGKRMPAFVIEEVIAKKEYRKKCMADMEARRKRFLTERGTLNVDIKT